MWDMLIGLGHYIFLLDEVRRAMAELDTVKPPKLDRPLDAEWTTRLHDVLTTVESLGNEGGLEMLVVDAQNGLTELPTCTYRQAATRLHHTHQSFTHEANKRQFWLIHADKNKYFEAGFGKKVATAFPDAAWEIREAGSCYALARNTAAVFHLMRAVEHGMRSLAVAVGVTTKTLPLEYQEWHNLIEQIESHAAGIDQWGRSAELTNARQFFKRIIADLYSFKDDVRNVTMHTRNKPYDSPSALGVRNRVRDFFLILVTKVAHDTPIGGVMKKSLFTP
jgi:hypothetical protein